jgi:hypothetical protein
MTLAEIELRNLRISVARLAQVAGVSLESVGAADDAPYEQLHEAAVHHQRGWNTLVGLVLDEIERSHYRRL